MRSVDRNFEVHCLTGRIRVSDVVVGILEALAQPSIALSSIIVTLAVSNLEHALNVSIDIRCFGIVGLLAAGSFKSRARVTRGWAADEAMAVDKRNEPGDGS
jgi:hypothetical protein